VCVRTELLEPPPPPSPPDRLGGGAGMVRARAPKVGAVLYRFGLPPLTSDLCIPHIAT